MTRLPQAVLDGFASSYAVACAFVTDADGRALIVKPTYGKDWQFVGGMVDQGEAPHEACAREIKEEIGIDLPVGDLLVLDYVPDHGFVSAPMTIYIFNCGSIRDPAQIRLQAEELEDFAFLPLDEATSRFHAVHAPRFQLADQARRTGRAAYVSHGGSTPR